MTENNLAIIVLAAGQGTRMKSRLPKVLHEISGRPLVGHVLTTATALGADIVEVVVRHERDQVVAALPTPEGLRLTCPRELKVAALAALAPLGTRLADVQIHEPSLEDVYFGLREL